MFFVLVVVPVDLDYLFVTVLLDPLQVCWKTLILLPFVEAM